MSKYTNLVSISVPASMLAGEDLKSSDPNQLALCIGESASDDQTFGLLNVQDANGNLYSFISTVMKPIVSDMIAAPLMPPAHAPNVDIAAATRAQSLLRFNAPASPDYIAVIVDDRSTTANEALERFGLTRIPSTEEA